MPICNPPVDSLLDNFLAHPAHTAARNVCLHYSCSPSSLPITCQPTLSVCLAINCPTFSPVLPSRLPEQFACIDLIETACRINSLNKVSSRPECITCLLSLQNRLLLASPAYKACLHSLPTKHDCIACQHSLQHRLQRRLLAWPVCIACLDITY
jgi:hypothetical protein